MLLLQEKLSWWTKSSSPKQWSVCFDQKKGDKGQKDSHRKPQMELLSGLFSSSGIQQNTPTSRVAVAWL